MNEYVEAPNGHRIVAAAARLPVIDGDPKIAEDFVAGTETIRAWLRFEGVRIDRLIAEMRHWLTSLEEADR